MVKIIPSELFVNLKPVKITILKIQAQKYNKLL